MRRYVLLAMTLLLFITGHARADVHLFSVGDWGIDSPDRQAVADAMAARVTADGAAPDAVLLLGDNFYVKLTGIDDPQIQSFFEKTYDPLKLGMPFFAVLGNHDYKGNDDVTELAYAARGGTRFKLPARWYRLELPAVNPLVTVLMLDSDQQAMSDAMWKEELKWIETELAKPHAPWLMCCGHHDMFGNGSHSDNGVLLTSWGPLFKKYGVDMYLCGHEHTLQHLEIPDWPISFVIAGGGGAARKPMLRDQRGPFSKSVLGFADLHFSSDTMKVELVGAKNNVLHAFERDHGGKVKVTVNTPSDPATTKPLKVINGGD